MSKTQEALKLALEALEKIAKTEYHIETPPIESLEEKMRRIASKVIPNLREALAEQPAQQPLTGLLSIARRHPDGQVVTVSFKTLDAAIAFERCALDVAYSTKEKNT